VIVLFGVSSLRRTRTGRALIATRDNELAAEAVTLDTIKMKLTAFVLSGMLAGLAGAVYVFHQRGLHTDAFGADVSVQLFSMVVIGGLGSLPGAVLGAMYVRGAQFFLHGGWSFVASGAGILVLLLFMPEGLGGVVYTLRDKYLRWVAKHRELLVPSMVADRREISGQPPGHQPAERPEILQEQEVTA
jgi:branched-chain amino acid transport system permease protein